MVDLQRGSVALLATACCTLTINTQAAETLQLAQLRTIAAETGLLQGLSLKH